MVNMTSAILAFSAPHVLGRVGQNAIGSHVTRTSAHGATYLLLGLAVPAVRHGMLGRVVRQRVALFLVGFIPVCLVKSQQLAAAHSSMNFQMPPASWTPSETISNAETRQRRPGQLSFLEGDDFLGEYLSGVTDENVAVIETFSQTPNATFGVNGRTQTNAVTGEVVECDLFCPSEISDVTELTNAFYGRLDFGHEFDNGWMLDGNFGVRYVETTVEAGGEVRFPTPDRFDAPVLDANGVQVGGGNGDGVVQEAEVNGFCTFQAQTAAVLPGSAH